MTIGENIRRIRLACGLSIRDVWDREKVDDSLVSRIETGRVDNYEIRTLRKIASALGVRTAALFIGPDGELVDVPGEKSSRPPATGTDGPSGK